MLDNAPLSPPASVFAECYLHGRHALGFPAIVALRWARIHAPEVVEARALRASLGYPAVAS